MKTSKRAQIPTVMQKKYEISKILSDFIMSANKVLEDKNTSETQTKMLISSMIKTIEEKILRKIDEVYAIKTMTSAKTAAKNDKLPGGVGDDVEFDEVNQKQLEMGQKVEMEHTDDKELAKEIALDHLAEQLKDGVPPEEQDYYDNLLKYVDPDHDAKDGMFPMPWRRNFDYGERQ